MSEVRVNNLSNENNTGGPTISGITTYSGRHYFVPPSGDTASRPEDCEPGSLRFNTDTAHLEYFRGDTIGWTEIEASSPELGGGTSSSNQNALGARAILGGGFIGIRTIEFLTVTTFGDTQDFGDLTTAGGFGGINAASTETRALFAGGYIVNNIEFITYASTGNSTDFGDLTQPKYMCSPVNDTVRAVFCGGAGSTPVFPSHGAEGNVLEYVTIATEGNGVDFGDTGLAKIVNSSVNSSTRGIFARSNSPVGPVAVFEFLTIRTEGNSTDFGDALTSGQPNGGGCSATRGVFAGGYLTNIIQYMTMATTGNSIDFGDLIQRGYNVRGSSSKTRNVIAGFSDYVNPGAGAGFYNFNTIQSIQISTTGNSVDFGDISYYSDGAAIQGHQQGCNAHGGI